MKSPTLAYPSLRSQSFGTPYLRLKLTAQQSALLPMEKVQEAIAIPTSRVSQIPNMPTCVLGLLNQKSRVVWVIDLPQMLGLQTQNLNVNQHYNIAIVRSEKTPLGLVVPEIRGILRFLAETMTVDPEPSILSINPYIQGCFTQDTERLWVLNPDLIIHSSILLKNH